jgi:diguanylate cyclase (GGDEF)-like protein/PAS domain S-box-containing protein
MCEDALAKLSARPRQRLESVLYIFVCAVALGSMFFYRSAAYFNLAVDCAILFPLLFWGAVRVGWHAVFVLVSSTILLASFRIGIGRLITLTAEIELYRYLYNLCIVLAGSGVLAIFGARALTVKKCRLNDNKSLNTYLQNTSDLFLETDENGRIQQVHHIRALFLDFAPTELVQGCLLDFVHPDDVMQTRDILKQIKQSHCIRNFVNRIGRTDKSVWHWVQWIFSYENNRIYAVARDISDQKKIEEDLQLAALVYQNSSEAMMVTDENNQIISINPAFTFCTGYAPEEVLGKNPRILSSGRQSPEFYKAMWHAINTTGKWQGEIYNRRKNSDVYVEWVIINSVFNDDGTVHRRVAQFTDITEQKTSEEIIWFQANFDPLTQLPNRRLFIDRLQQELKKAKRDQYSLAVLFIDLDRFKDVNDSLGHSTGDNLLAQAASRLKGCVRQSDTVARLGGDEFTVIVPELHDTGGVEKVVKHILSALEQPFVLGESTAYVSASIGITFAPGDTDNYEDLIRYADQAMYAAKNEGRNGFRYFTPSMQLMMDRHAQVVQDLRTALEEKQFRAYFQPIVDLKSNKIEKAEALIRWQHPERGMMCPDDFIPVAEETGLINEIGDWIFEQAVETVGAWRACYHDQFQISVNKSPVQFNTQDNVHSHWTDFLLSSGLPGNSIVIEITEGLLLDARDQVIEKLDYFRSQGMQLAIDDFGTGYSALAYLKKFQIDFLKIDRSFTQNLQEHSSDMALCEAIIVMAHKLGMKVIAEGIETEQQCRLLISAGCDYGQGYWFGKPMLAEEFERKFLSGDERFQPSQSGKENDFSSKKTLIKS